MRTKVLFFRSGGFNLVRGNCVSSEEKKSDKIRECVCNCNCKIGKCSTHLLLAEAALFLLGNAIILVLN